MLYLERPERAGKHGLGRRENTDVEQKKISVAVTGATGNMGQAVLEQLTASQLPLLLRVLVLPDDKKRAKKLKKRYAALIRAGGLQIVYGNLADPAAVQALIAGTDYVVNLAAVIPPLSDQKPALAVECNQVGADVLVSAIERAQPQPKLIHISTVALYGNRDEKHLWARVGDPLLVSPYDVYSATKLRGELRVLESGIEHWAVLRQSAMLHKNMLADNLKDGLMFHTCFNAPLEWVTAHDSGVLIAHIIERDVRDGGVEGFWTRVFNIGAPARNRITGYETYNEGFRLIGGSAKNFFRPGYNAVRNFHGVWFADADRLETLFSYQRQSTADYWAEIRRTHRYYSLAKIVPKALIRRLVIEHLRKDANAPAYWKKHGETGKLTAFFGGEAQYDAQPSRWEEFPLLCEGKNSRGEPVDYDALRDIRSATALDYGFDAEKADADITIDDLRAAAAAHGGALVTETFKTGDLYAPVEWRTQDGEVFTARPYSVLRAGHWFNRTYKENVWEFDRLARRDRVYAQIWYDTHAKDEAFVYSMDGAFRAKIESERE